MDLAATPTAPFEPSPVHTSFAAFAGRWRGEVKTWFDPEGEPMVDTWTLDAELLLGGRFLRLTYAGSVGGTPNGGQFTIARHNTDARIEASWIDSFHTNTANMACFGPDPDGGPLRFLGTYPDGQDGPRWGWRTTIGIDPEGVLCIDAENLHPDTTADRAIEARLARES